MDVESELQVNEFPSERAREIYDILEYRLNVGSVDLKTESRGRLAVMDGFGSFQDKDEVRGWVKRTLLSGGLSEPEVEKALKVYSIDFSHQEGGPYKAVVALPLS